MMSLTVRERASIAHTHPWCGPDLWHGHDLEISATLEGPREIRSADMIVGSLRAVIHEIDRRDLAAATPGSDGSLWALAAWIHERLSQSYPALSSVSVSFMGGDAVATYRRDI